MRINLNDWEYDFIQSCLEKEIELHDKENFEKEEEADRYLKRLQDLGHKFKLDYLEE